MTTLINQDVERAILGMILVNNENLPAVMSQLQPDDFGLDAHRRIYAASVELSDLGQGVNTLTLMEKLTALQQLQTIGGAAYLAGLTDGIPLGARVNNYCQIVKDKSRRRRLVNICDQAKTMAEDGTETTCACVAEIQNALLEIEADSAKESVLHVAQCTDGVFSELKALRSQADACLGLTTGVATLDEATGGIRRGELWYVGARPGRGKSALATQVLEANAKQEMSVLMFSVEMTKAQLLRRMWARVAGVPFWKIKDPRNANDDEWSRISNAAGKVAQWPFWIDENSGLTIDELVSRAVLGVKRNNVQLVIVDYVQRVAAKGKDEIERVTNVSKKLARLAKDYVPVLALSQMPRANEHNINKIPNMQDLKGSSDLEQDAHVILLLHRPVDEETKQFTGEDLIIIEKQREGEMGLDLVRFDGDMMRFEPRCSKNLARGVGANG